MAEHARITDCDVAPTARRTLLRGTAAALTGRGLAAVLLSPDPNWAPPGSHPDAQLLTLCSEFDELERACQLTFDTYPSSFEGEEEAAGAREPLEERQRELIDRICELRATTLAGLSARAATIVLFAEDLAKADEDDFHDKRMVSSLLRDLTAEAVL